MFAVCDVDPWLTCLSPSQATNPLAAVGWLADRALLSVMNLRDGPVEVAADPHRMVPVLVEAEAEATVDPVIVMVLLSHLHAWAGEEGGWRHRMDRSLVSGAETGTPWLQERIFFMFVLLL